MNYRKALWVGLVASVAGAATICWAQTPPAVPAAPAAPANLWSFLLPSPEQKLACKTAFCNSPIGKLLNGAGGPMSAMSGGLMGGRCEKNSIANDLKKKPADDPDGLAARVKNDEEEAKARRASVRFLGTVDCNYWPEAIDILKTALRKDRNECVRFEAALALRNGCCCNNEIIDALKQSILGENKTDPNPVEKSERVRAVAAEALARCPMIADPKKDEKLLTSNPSPNLEPAEYYKKIAQMPRDEVLAGARAVLVSMQKNGKLTPASMESAGSPVGSAVAPIPQRATSVSGIVASAFAPSGEGPRPPFFSNLTKTLTGNQGYGMPATKETIVPATMGTIPPRELKLTAPAPLTRPTIPTGDFAADRPSLARPVRDILPPPNIVELPVGRARDNRIPLAIHLSGPNKVAFGKEAVFEVRVGNESAEPITSLVLFAWLSEGLRHPAGQEIKGEVQLSLAPGEVRTLRLPTQAVKSGRGNVRVKVVTAAGEASATTEIDIIAAQLVGQQAKASLAFAAGKADAVPAGVNSTANPTPVRKTVAPLQIIQSAPGGDSAAVVTSGTRGLVTLEEMPSSPVTLFPKGR